MIKNSIYGTGYVHLGIAFEHVGQAICCVSYQNEKYEVNFLRSGLCNLVQFEKDIKELSNTLAVEIGRTNRNVIKKVYIQTYISSNENILKTIIESALQYYSEDFYYQQYFEILEYKTSLIERQKTLVAIINSNKLIIHKNTNYDKIVLELRKSLSENNILSPEFIALSNAVGEAEYLRLTAKPINYNTITTGLNNIFDYLNGSYDY